MERIGQEFPVQERIYFLLLVEVFLMAKILKGIDCGLQQDRGQLIPLRILPMEPLGLVFPNRMRCLIRLGILLLTEQILPEGRFGLWVEYQPPPPSHLQIISMESPH